MLWGTYTLLSHSFSILNHFAFLNLILTAAFYYEISLWKIRCFGIPITRNALYFVTWSVWKILWSIKSRFQILFISSQPFMVIYPMLCLLFLFWNLLFIWLFFFSHMAVFICSISCKTLLVWELTMNTNYNSRCPLGKCVIIHVSSLWFLQRFIAGDAIIDRILLGDNAEMVTPMKNVCFSPTYFFHLPKLSGIFLD